MNQKNLSTLFKAMLIWKNCSMWEIYQLLFHNQFFLNFIFIYHWSLQTSPILRHGQIFNLKSAGKKFDAMRGPKSKKDWKLSEIKERNRSLRE